MASLPSLGSRASPAMWALGLLVCSLLRPGLALDYGQGELQPLITSHHPNIWPPRGQCYMKLLRGPQMLH